MCLRIEWRNRRCFIYTRRFHAIVYYAINYFHTDLYANKIYAIRCDNKRWISPIPTWVTSPFECLSNRCTSNFLLILYYSYQHTYHASQFFLKQHKLCKQNKTRVFDVCYKLSKEKTLGHFRNVKYLMTSDRLIHTDIEVQSIRCKLRLYFTIANNFLHISYLSYILSLRDYLGTNKITKLTN